MRRIKYDDADLAKRDAVARSLREQGRIAEAILLYDGRADHPELASDLEKAIREGKAFHVLALRRTGTTVSNEQIRACAVAAESKGRWLDAHRCYTVLADAEALARIAPQLPGYTVAVPANKV
jgi:hypothetical protein